jgi:hypothetical protein
MYSHGAHYRRPLSSIFNVSELYCFILEEYREFLNSGIVPDNIFLTSLNSKIVCQKDALYVQVRPVHVVALLHI